MYVLIEMNGIAEHDWLKKIGSRCKILGLNSEKPFLQIGPYIFQGEYEDTVGTSLVFEEQNGETLKYKCQTHKKLVMQRSFLNLKSVPQTEEEKKNEDVGKEEDKEKEDKIKEHEKSNHPSTSSDTNLENPSDVTK